MADAVKTFIVNSDKSILEFNKQFQALYNEHKYLSASVRIGRDRSIEQNATWSAMYKQIGRVLEWGFLHARAHCKWYYGIPILARDFDGFRDSFERIFGQMSEEACLRLMNSNKLFPVHGFPVTRCFSVAQGSEYIDSIANHFSTEGVTFEGVLNGTD